MSRYIVQRSAWVAVVLIGISVFTFALLHLTPGDPAQILLGPIATPQELARLHRELGLDRPLATQYVLWLAHVAQGDLGRSITLHRPVLGELLLRFRGTIILGRAGGRRAARARSPAGRAGGQPQGRSVTGSPQ